MPLSDTAGQQELLGGLSDANFHLAFAWRDQPDDWHVEIAPTLEAVSDRLKEVATAAAADLHSARSRVAYGVDQPLDETHFFALDNPVTGSPASTPIGGDLFPQLADFGQLQPYGTSRRRSSPRAYVVIAQLDDGSIATFGRAVTPSQLLRSSRWIRVLWTGETFDLLDDGPVLALDPYVDWIEWKHTVIVLNDRAFHRMFSTIEQLRAAVQGHVDAITAVIPIANAAEFIARCQGMPSMASKLATVVEQELFKKPVAELKGYSNRYPGLGVVWSGNELVFDDDLERQWSILRLLDEAGFTGELSGEKFEAPSKRQL